MAGSTWYACKFCQTFFESSLQLKKHKLLKHVPELLRIKNEKRKKRGAAAIADLSLEAVPVPTAVAATADGLLEAIPPSVAPTPEVPNPDEAVLEEIEPPKPKKFRFAAEPSDASFDEVRICNEALPEVPVSPDGATFKERDPRETHSEVPDTVPAFPEVQLPADAVAYLDSEISAQAPVCPDPERDEFSAEEMLPESTTALEAPSEVPDSILETTPQDESLFESTSSRTTCPEEKACVQTPAEEEPSSPFQALLDAIFECESEVKAISSDQSLFEESSQNTSFRDDLLSESQHIFTGNSSEDGECVPGFKTIRNASDSNYETIGNDASKSESLTEEQGQAVMESYIKEAESSICSTDLVKKELIRENEENFRQSKSVSCVEQKEDKTADEEDEDFDLSFLTADDMGYPEGVTRDPNGSKSDIVVAIKVEPMMESAIQLNDFYQKYSNFKRAHLKNEFKQSYRLHSAKTAHYTEYQWSKDDQQTQHLLKASSDGQLGNMEWEALDDHRRNTLEKFNGIESNETMVQGHNGTITRHDLSEPESGHAQRHAQQNYAQVNHPSLQRHAMVEPSPYPVAPRQNMTAPPAVPRTNMAAPPLIYTAASRGNMATIPHYYPMPNVAETQRNVSNFMRPWQSPSQALVPTPTQQQHVSQLQVPPMALTQPETVRFTTQQQWPQHYMVPRQQYPNMASPPSPDRGQSMYGKFRSDIFTQPGQEHVVTRHPYRPWQAAEQGVTGTRQTLCQQQPCVCGTGSMQNLSGPVISPSMPQPPRHGHHNSPRINTVESVQNNSDGGDQPRQNVPGPVHEVQFEQQSFDHFQMVMRMRELGMEMARKREIRQALHEKITSTLMQNVPEQIQVSEPDRHHFTEHNPTIPERCNASEYGRRRRSLSLCQPPPSYLNVPEPVLVTDTGRDTPDPTQWSEPRQNVPEPFILEVESVSAIPEREPQVLRQTTPAPVIPVVKITPIPLIEPISAPGHQPSATDADVEHLFSKYQLAEYLYREDPSCRSYICTFCVRNFQLFKSALSHVLQHKVGLTQNGDMGRLQGCMQEYCQNFRVIKYKKRVGRRLTPLKNRGPLDFHCPLLDCGRQFAKQSGLKSHLKRHETISIVSGRKELPAVNDDNGSSSFSGITRNLDGIRVEVITTSGCQTVPEGLTDSANDADEGQISAIPKPACNTCGNSFENEDDLLTHLCRPPSPPKFHIRRRKRRATKQPHSKQNFSCSVCDESFQHRTPFKHHMMDVHGKFTATCSFCSKTFTTRWSLDYHLKMHIGRNLKLERKLFPRIQKKREPYVYAPSSTGKSTIRRVMAALKNHVPPPAGSTSKSPLLIQLLQKKRLPHNKSSRASQRSRGPVADEPVQPQSARTLPPRKHWKKAVLDKIRPKPSTSVMAYASVGTHSCSKCGLSFHSSVELDIHDSQTHTGKTLIEVEYCTFCGLMYWNSKRLEEHTQLHETQQLECVCQKCNQRFDSIQAFNNHMSQQHRPV